MFQCRRCGNLRGEPRPSGPTVCDECWGRAVEDEASRVELAARVPEGRVVGPQPSICSWAECSRPFVAPRSDVKFCSSSCRGKSWRAARRRELEAA